MNEQKILIPIKVGEELPKEEGVYFIDLNTDKPEMVSKDVSWFRPNYDNEVWEENIRVWYKPVSIDELLPSRQEKIDHIKQLKQREFMDKEDVIQLSIAWVINHIKNKLNGTE